MNVIKSKKKKGMQVLNNAACVNVILSKSIICSALICSFPSLHYVQEKKSQQIIKVHFIFFLSSVSICFAYCYLYLLHFT